MATPIIGLVSGYSCLVALQAWEGEKLYLAKLTIYRCCDKVSDFSRKPLVFSLPNRLPTITIGYCFINHHKPTTLCCHGNNFGYVVAYSFAYTMVSADFLRNVPIIRYLHLSTNTHKFVVFYSLDCNYVWSICM